MWQFSFVCRASKARKNGLSPVELIINIGGKRSYIPLPMMINATIFKEKMNGLNSNNEVIEYTSIVRTQLIEYANRMMVEGKEVTTDMLKEYFKNGGVVTYTCGKLQRDFIKYYTAKCKANNCTGGVIKKYVRVMELFVDFIGADTNINNVSTIHIEEFKIALMEKYERTTVGYMLAKLKCAFKYAIDKGELKHNIFGQIQIDRRSKEVEKLSNEELEVIKNKEMNDRLGKVRDCFLFQCHTGLSYADMAQVEEGDVKQEQGIHFINKTRQKTKVPFFTILDDEAMELLRKYEYKLPVLSNQKYNSYLKEIGDICNIKTPLHSHIARHTCATRLLNDGIPMEIVARVLGHTSTKQTQHYAKLLDRTVLNAFKKRIG